MARTTVPKLPLHLLVLIIMPLHFQDNRLAIGEPDQVVRSKFANDAGNYGDLKSKVPILTQADSCALLSSARGYRAATFLRVLWNPQVTGYYSEFGRPTTPDSALT